MEQIDNPEPNQQNTEGEDSIPETNENKEKKQEAQQAEILDSLPPEVQETVKIAMSMSSFTGRMPNPLLTKINESHITTILQQSGIEENNNYKDSQSSKLYSLVYVIIFVALVIFLIVFLVDRDKDLLFKLSERVLYIVGGFGGGYGFKAYKDNKKK